MDRLTELKLGLKYLCMEYSMKLKLLRSTDLFCLDLKTFLFHFVYGTKIRIDSVMCPRSSSRKRNKSASVTVTVTVT